MVSVVLKKIRIKMGYASARAFFQEHLSERTRPDFNYSYYMKVEGGRAMPSAAVISQIAEVLAEPLQSELVAAYCQTLFPKQAALFRLPAPSRAPRQTAPFSPPPLLEADGSMLLKPRSLTPAQVGCLAQSRPHYFTFLILTLARHAVAIDDLSVGLGGADAAGILADLARAKLAYVELAKASSLAREMKFPEADSGFLKEAYRRIDAWNLEAPKALGFEEAVGKMLIRRISARYLSLLIHQSTLIFEMMRASGEVQADHNEEIVMLNFSLTKGVLPG